MSKRSARIIDDVPSAVGDLFDPTSGELVPVVIRTMYQPTLKVVVDCSVEPSLTVQADLDSCDINQIMARYDRTQLDVFADRVNSGIYQDLASMPDYHSAMDIVVTAQEAFDALPADLRSKFQNDPAQFLDFVEDPSNSAELVKLGLASSVLADQPSSPPSPSSGADATEGAL